MANRKTSVISIAALVALMMGMNAGIANAANYQGSKGCARSQVGVAGITHRGTAIILAPGGTVRRSFNNRQTMKWNDDWANRNGGDHWSITALAEHHSPYTYCETGNP